MPQRGSKQSGLLSEVKVMEVEMLYARLGGVWILPVRFSASSSSTTSSFQHHTER
jgi:hypothetical protein